MVRVLATVVRTIPFVTFCYPSCSDCLVKLANDLHFTIFGPDPLDDLFGLPATKFQEKLNALYHTSPTVYTHQDLQRHVWDALEWIVVGELYSFDLRFRQRGTMQESVVANMSLLHVVPMTVLDHLRQSLPDRGPKYSILNLSLMQVTGDSTTIANNKLAGSMLDSKNLGEPHMDHVSSESHLVDSTREPHTHTRNNKFSYSSKDDRAFPLEPPSCPSTARRRSRLIVSNPSTDDDSLIINTQLSELSLGNRPIPQLSPTGIAADPPPRQAQTEFEGDLDWGGIDLTDFNLDDLDEDEFGDDEELIKILVEMVDGERAGSTY
ncbi:hypothetical protein BC937DRAFT_88374 [Endogone sp. FLAS-F59071]|nr:hypothetical protein BC937DRAFT_88374 [Endogone sp. FLAS-F59071]|eukprot:RUS18769.1 hypothetical protein BC937DRAFT_88374 [Endogone sp. FLAS-F59071]